MRITVALLKLHSMHLHLGLTVTELAKLVSKTWPGAGDARRWFSRDCGPFRSAHFYTASSVTSAADVGGRVVLMALLGRRTSNVRVTEYWSLFDGRWLRRPSFQPSRRDSYIRRWRPMTWHGGCLSTMYHWSRSLNTNNVHFSALLRCRMNNRNDIGLV